MLMFSNNVGKLGTYLGKYAYWKIKNKKQVDKVLGSYAYLKSRNKIRVHEVASLQDFEMTKE